MTGRELPLDLAAAAERGQWCPKLCSHTCPVLRATGRSDAVPWSFHRTVADLVSGRLDPVGAADRLVACTGCGACATSCEIEGQDVPAQVRAGRAAVRAAGAAPACVSAAEEAVESGLSPYGVHRPTRLRADHADVALVAGCRDDAASVEAAVKLLTAAGERVDVVEPHGCCGAVLADLGAETAAVEARSMFVDMLDEAVAGVGSGGGRVVLLDPHCRSAVAGRAGVVDLVEHLAALVAADRLSLTVALGAVRWHEPCVLRETSAAGAGHEVLTGLGALVELPGERAHGCSGGGMGLPLLDPDASRAVAADRGRALAGGGPLVTGCAGAVSSLGEIEPRTTHLVVLLASLLDDPPESVA